jgi:hypothetical protein
MCSRRVFGSLLLCLVVGGCAAAGDGAPDTSSVDTGVAETSVVTSVVPEASSTIFGAQTALILSVEPTTARRGGAVAIEGVCTWGPDQPVLRVMVTATNLSNKFRVFLSPDLDQGGRFSVTLDVPADAVAGTYSLSVQCSVDDMVVASLRLEEALTIIVDETEAPESASSLPQTP